MAKKKKEPKGFKIICLECGNESNNLPGSGGIEESFYISARINPCELCGDHGQVSIECAKCRSEKEIKSW